MSKDKLDRGAAVTALADWQDLPVHLPSAVLGQGGDEYRLLRDSSAGAATQRTVSPGDPPGGGVTVVTLCLTSNMLHSADGPFNNSIFP